MPGEPIDERTNGKASVLPDVHAGVPAGAQTRERWLTVAEAAQALAVSEATVRNWLRAGRLAGSRRGRSLALDERELLRLRESLRSGKDTRLRSRRNKSAVGGRALPAAYGTGKTGRQLASAIAEASAGADDAALALLETALLLLTDRGHLPAAGSAEAGCANRSLSERFAAGELDAAPYAAMLAAICPPSRVAAASQDALAALRAVARLPVAFREGEDLLGLLHMSLSMLRTRKKGGSYYTPAPIAAQLVDQCLALCGDEPAPRFVDPCCGTGMFLIRAYLALKARFIAGGMPAAEADGLIRSRCLTGCDIDPVAVALARVNLALLGEPSGPIDLDDRLFVGDSLEPAPEPDGLNDGAYDIVVGNPPWGVPLAREQRRRLADRYETAAGSGDSFALFLERGIGLLRPGGTLAFVLPESLLAVGAHEPVRKLLLECSSLLRIEALGQSFSHVNSEAIALTLRKSPATARHRVAIEASDGNHRALQRRFAGNEISVFNIGASDDDHRILERMRAAGGGSLAGHAEFALGIVTGDNSRWVLRDMPDDGEAVVAGADVFQYNVFPAEPRYIRFQPELFQQVAPARMYRAPEKLLYRFINAQLVFAYDETGLLSLNSANVLIPQLDGFPAKAVMAVLNSRAAQFYYRCAFASVKVLRRHIESIPLPRCLQPEQERLVRLVDGMLASRNAAERASIFETIDALIMDLYALPAASAARIRAKIPATRFLTPDYV
ncbi:MAG: N-6 DNA methylase [Paenibacillaceae bacterium]|nr:N-6 DNA methylase [Paenibacillaceae bacterium]